MMLMYWKEIVFICFCVVVLIQLFFYGFYFSRLAWYSKKDKQTNRQHPVSVVVCARDEANNLVNKLPGVLVQSYPTTHEVIVVNDNSFDESKYLLEELRKTFKHLNVVELTQEAMMIPGKKFPLSIGIKTAKYEILLLTDADCLPASEFWMEKMQDAYTENTDIVLGYGAYAKHSGLLNKLIRFETFQTALQYLSFALAGQTYMGVGRNLSYKRDVFFRNKGFAALNRLPSGDDDLFINMAAGKNNVSICVDHEAHTISEPKKTLAEWWKQKARHYTTAKYYKPIHRFLLSLFSGSQFMLYPLLIITCIFHAFSWWLPLAIFGVRFLLQGIVYYKAMRKLNENDLWPIWWLLDVWMFIYYIIFLPTLFKRPSTGWK